MSTATRKCTGCKGQYPSKADTWIKCNAGWFHDQSCANEYRIAKQEKQALRHLAKTRKDREKSERKAWKTRKAKLKGLSYWIKQTKLVAQEYAAIRDSDKGCVSCGMGLEQQNNEYLTRFDGGHFKTVGSHPELQLYTLNIHGQCRKCNGFEGGKPVEYEAELVERYGMGLVDFLNGPHEAQHWDIAYLEKYRKTIRKKTRLIKKRLNA